MGIFGIIIEKINEGGKTIFSYYKIEGEVKPVANHELSLLTYNIIRNTVPEARSSP